MNLKELKQLAEEVDYFTAYKDDLTPLNDIKPTTILALIEVAEAAEELNDAAKNYYFIHRKIISIHRKIIEALKKLEEL